MAETVEMGKNDVENEINGEIKGEKEFKVPEYLLNAKKDAVDDCSLLYCGRRKPMSESLMCFGWEHGDGWNDAVAKLSYRLEMLNLVYYPKYGVRVEAMQVKEKFGTLRYYYDVVTDPPRLVRFLPELLERLYRWVERKVDFGRREVVDREAHRKEEWEEITKDEYDAKKCPEYVSNEFGWKFREEGGKYFRNRCIFVPVKWHFEYTRHRIIHALNDMVWRLHCLLDFRYSWPYSRATRVAARFLDSEAAKYVREAEQECYEVCEDCGTQIGTSWSPRCCTNGWIGYVCEKCAKRRGGSYKNLGDGDGKSAEDGEGCDD